MPERDVEVYYQSEWRIGVPSEDDPISTHSSPHPARRRALRAETGGSLRRIVVSIMSYTPVAWN